MHSRRQNRSTFSEWTDSRAKRDAESLAKECYGFNTPPDNSPVEQRTLPRGLHLLRAPSPPILAHSHTAPRDADPHAQRDRFAMPHPQEHVVVTGGAGYIGSHAVKLLVESGYSVTVLDNLSRGHRSAVHDDATFVEVDLRETRQLESILRNEQPSAVMHFAALTYVGESVDDPMWYYDNNVGGTLSLLKAIQAAGIPRLVFSSTAATYGEPEVVPIQETTRQAPINPYGQSKYFAERMIEDLCQATPEFGAVILRYFNVAGCAEDGTLGEDHRPETHLVPILLQAALGKRDSVTVFGSDYPTPDGTCIRDYVHVEDLCQAHLLAMNAIEPGKVEAYNVGIGRGYSVRQLIESAFRVTGKQWPVIEGTRRAGDPSELFADPAKIQNKLGWHPQFTNIDDIVATAWNWFSHHPDGYLTQTYVSLP